VLIDEASIFVRAGNGGNGVVSFRREAHVPRGGPDGGNGGKGGNVYLMADPKINTLFYFQHHQRFEAPNGGHGSGQNRTGAQGDDVVIPVPVGTVAHRAEDGSVLADLTEPNQRVLVARGGRPGRGNRVFRSPTNQAPRIAENGEPGEVLQIRLEMKMMADVGLVGVPNAGKSTLLSRVSAARPKIADYPFTTLEPMLGVVVVGDRDMVLADIPGLIEGAHTGVGLGHTFLRHIERTRVLIHLINGLSPDPLGDYDAINQELELFNPALRDKPQIVVLNKIDMPEVKVLWPKVARGLRERGVEEPMAVSALTGEGLNQLMGRAIEVVSETALPPPVEVDAVPVITPEDERNFTIYQDADGAYRVRGRRIERIVAMTKWDYYDAVMRFQRIMEALGITEALRAAGIEEGDYVRIGDKELEWSEENAL
jgi:GTP-binding protein